MWPCSEAATADGHARYARLARYNPANPPLWGEVPESGWRVRVSLGFHRISRSRLTQGTVSLPPMSLATPLAMPTSRQGASSEAATSAGHAGWPCEQAFPGAAGCSPAQTSKCPPSARAVHLQRGQAPTDDVWYHGPLSGPGSSPPGAGVCSRVPYSSRSPQSSDLEETGQPREDQIKSISS